MGRKEEPLELANWRKASARAVKAIEQACKDIKHLNVIEPSVVEGYKRTIARLESHLKKAKDAKRIQQLRQLQTDLKERDKINALLRRVIRELHYELAEARMEEPQSASAIEKGINALINKKVLMADRTFGSSREELLREVKRLRALQASNQITTATWYGGAGGKAAPGDAARSARDRAAKGHLLRPQADVMAYLSDASDHLSDCLLKTPWDPPTTMSCGVQVDDGSHEKLMQVEADNREMEQRIEDLKERMVGLTETYNDLKGLHAQMMERNATQNEREDALKAEIKATTAELQDTQRDNMRLQQEADSDRREANAATLRAEAAEVAMAQLRADEKMLTTQLTDLREAVARAEALVVERGNQMDALRKQVEEEFGARLEEHRVQIESTAEAVGDRTINALRMQGEAAAAATAGGLSRVEAAMDRSKAAVEANSAVVSRVAEADAQRESLMESVQTQLRTSVSAMDAMQATMLLTKQDNAELRRQAIAATALSGHQGRMAKRVTRAASEKIAAAVVDPINEGQFAIRKDVKRVQNTVDDLNLRALLIKYHKGAYPASPAHIPEDIASVFEDVDNVEMGDDENEAPMHGNRHHTLGDGEDMEPAAGIGSDAIEDAEARTRVHAVKPLHAAQQAAFRPGGGAGLGPRASKQAASKVRFDDAEHARDKRRRALLRGDDWRQASAADVDDDAASINSASTTDALLQETVGVRAALHALLLDNVDVGT